MTGPINRENFKNRKEKTPAPQAPVKFRPPRKDKTKRKEKTTKEIQEAAPSETVKPPVTPKPVELPYMGVPPIEEKIPVAERLKAIREKEVKYKLKAAVEDDDGARRNQDPGATHGGNLQGIARDIEKHERAN